MNLYNLACICLLFWEYGRVISLTFNERVEFRDHKVEENLIKSVSSSTTVECCRQCRTFDNCASFSYNSQTSMCNLISDINTNVTGIIDNGWKYYAKECPENEGYMFFSIWCIKFHEASVTYQEAVAACKLEGSNLIRIDSAEKHDAVSSKLSEKYKIGGKMYIQGKRIGSSNSWMFDDGAAIVYTPWNIGQPDNTNNQNNLLMNADSGWKWHDCGPTYPAAYICEHLLP